MLLWSIGDRRFWGLCGPKTEGNLAKTWGGEAPPRISLQAVPGSPGPPRPPQRRSPVDQKTMDQNHFNNRGGFELAARGPRRIDPKGFPGPGGCRGGSHSGLGRPIPSRDGAARLQIKSVGFFVLQGHVAHRGYKAIKCSFLFCVLLIFWGAHVFGCGSFPATTNTRNWMCEQ